MLPLERLGKYEVHSAIGRGAAGVVYAGLDPVLARPVAIKVIPLEVINDYDNEHYIRFKKEAQAAARMHHSHIVAVYDYGETERHAYIVMEYLAGGSLKIRLKQDNILPLPDIERIMRALLDGLQHSHENAVIHRDIKPANIVFNKDGELKITDFGIARLDSGGMTVDGATLGTPAYMSPEQVKGETADARSDLYSAGVILFEMLAGQRPFEGSAQSLMHNIVNAPVPRLADLAPPIPARFDDLLARALAKAPADRFQSAGEMWEAVEAAFRQTEPPPRPTPPKAPPLQEVTQEETVLQRPATPPVVEAPIVADRQTWKRAVVILVVLGVVGGAGAWFIWAPSRQISALSQQVASVPPPPLPTQLAPPPALPAPVTPAPPSKPVPLVTPSSPSPPDPLAGWQQSLHHIIGTTPCSLLRGEVSARGEVVLTGLTGLSDASQLEISAALRRALTQAMPLIAMAWDVRHLDGPYCSVLAALQPLITGSSLTIAISSGQDGRVASVATALPHVRVDRFMPDGQVEHLTQIPTTDSAPVVFDAKTIATGDLLAVIAAANPLPERGATRFEDSSAYLEKLKNTTSSVQKSHAEIAADALPVAGALP